MSGLGKRARYGQWIARTAGAAVAVALTLAVDARAELEPCEVAKLTDDPPGKVSDFGQKVAIDGDLIAVTSAQGHGFYSGWPGTVHLFRRDGLSWNPEAVLVQPGPDRETGFGYALAIQGDVVVVGAEFDSEPVYYSGEVYVYRRVDSEWVLDGHLTAWDADGFERFGRAVAIDGDRILVSAWTDSPEGITEAGSAYVFRSDGADWIPEAKLADPDAEPWDGFGCSVALSGDVALIGAPSVNLDEGLEREGAALVFRYDGKQWVYEARLEPGEFGPIRLGWSVALSCDPSVAAIGGTQYDSQNGAVFVFRYSEGEWVREATLQAAEPSGPFPYLGNSVALNETGDLLVTGAPFDWAHGWDSGAAHVFRCSADAWSEAAKLTGSDEEPGSYFGGWVALDEDTAIIGAHDSTEEPGAAYMFRGLIPADCNGNGVSDGCDIALGTSQDVNENGIPDECECLADVTGDDTVNVLDLLAILAAWGASGGDVPEDVNFDGIVDVMDLLSVLSSWGPC